MDIKDLMPIITVLIVSIFLFFSIREFIKRGSKDRADFLLRLRDRFKTNELYMSFQSLVENDDNDSLTKTPLQDINRLIGFYEEIYLFSNISFMSKEVYFYLFGQYALDCYENTVLKERLCFDTTFRWSQFVKFCHEYKNWKSKNPTFILKV
jgi:hypothetical protein